MQSNLAADSIMVFRLFSIGVIAVSSLILSEGKVQKGSFDVISSEDHTVQFVSKFGYAIGDGRYRMRTRLKQGAELPKSPYLDFHIFLDERWSQVEDLSSCKSVRSAAQRNQPLYLTEPGEWSYWTFGTLSQMVRPHIWYFAVSNCNQKLAQVPVSIEYEIEMTQGDGSEFSVEMQNMLAWNSFGLMCLTAFIIRYCFRCHAFACSAGRLHQVLWILAAAMGFQFTAQALHTIHLWAYRSDGIGIHSLDVCSEVLFMLSQVVQTTLLIAIGMGYTLLPSRGCHLLIVKWIAALSLVIHVGLVSFNKVQDESACKYHENEGAIGWVLLSVRIMLLCWFEFAAQASQQRGGLRLHDFLQRFRLAGGIYFLAYPLLFLAVQIFAPYVQHPIMQIGLLTMQTASHVWLADLFLSRGTYFKCSALSCSLLPGICGGGMFDKLS